MRSLIDWVTGQQISEETSAADTLCVVCVGWVHWAVRPSPTDRGLLGNSRMGRWGGGQLVWVDTELWTPAGNVYSGSWSGLLITFELEREMLLSGTIIVHN